MVRTLTGNLNANIDSCPPFPGKERHFLRAQIARIQHATEICPKGLFEIDEETNEQKYSEEFGMPGTEELKNVDLSKITELQDDTDLSGEIACAGGACEI